MLASSFLLYWSVYKFFLKVPVIDRYFHWKCVKRAFENSRTQFHDRVGEINWKILDI